MATTFFGRPLFLFTGGVSLALATDCLSCAFVAAGFWAPSVPSVFASIFFGGAAAATAGTFLGRPLFLFTGLGGASLGACCGGASELAAVSLACLLAVLLVLTSVAAAASGSGSCSPAGTGFFFFGLPRPLLGVFWSGGECFLGLPRPLFGLLGSLGGFGAFSFSLGAEAAGAFGLLAKGSSR